MTNPYIPAEVMLAKRKAPREEAKEIFYNRVQRLLASTIDDFGIYGGHAQHVKVTLRQTELYFDDYTDILREHCKLLNDAGYSAEISYVNPIKGKARLLVALLD